ncbi:ferritin-like domain-containing protein [Pseudoalteromonas ruthenica]|uniref:ferritin-like domain-containing protein n=1 Tax=Pseudoalteromonas ruthenica TaxID=151081 RepID=UPI00110A96FA|nr:PA2169 family four-helix-bundle protein [Pseudoalteromonas ruthenica]TMO88384.1 hypothetical protein CWC12_09430 [Pseudoalteromonas ruthenica]TMP24321.1 hypothetical protein CWC06_08600 [Pseudoalteromonas ruthenica]
MTMQRSEKITDIIKVLKGGIDFYSDAKDNIDSNDVRTVFQNLIDEKHKAVTDLQPFAIEEQGEIETGSDTLVDVRKTYTKVMSAIKSNEEHTYIKHLEEVEDKVLEEFDDALEESQPPQCAQVLSQLRERMQICHDKMKALQEATS